MSGAFTTDERLARIVAAVLDVEAGSLSDEDSPETVESWDSIQHIQLIIAIEAEFGIQFSAEEIGELNSIGRLRRRVEEGTVIS